MEREELEVEGGEKERREVEEKEEGEEGRGKEVEEKEGGEGGRWKKTRGGVQSGQMEFLTRCKGKHTHMQPPPPPPPQGMCSIKPSA